MYTRVSFGPRLTPMIKTLILVCAGVWLVQLVSPGRDMEVIFGLSSMAVFTKGFIWQPLTYIFLHGGFWHLAINMFVLWMFGADLEAAWGRREFLRFFLITGVGGGICSMAFDPFGWVPTIGASGSVYGVLIAFGMLYPNRTVLLYFLFPIKVKYFVAFMVALVFFSSLSDSGGMINNFAHFGGMLAAFLYLRGWLSPGGIRQSIHRAKIRRMRSRFQVHEPQTKKRREDDFWIN